MMTYLGKTTTIADSSGNIGNIDSIGDLSITADEIEDTVYGTGGYKTFVQGLKDGGTVDLTLNYLSTDTSHNRLVTAFNAGTSELYTVTFPDSSTFKFTAFVAGVGIATPKDEKVQRTFTLRIDGKTAPAFGEATT